MCLWLSGKSRKDEVNAKKYIVYIIVPIRSLELSEVIPMLLVLVDEIYSISIQCQRNFGDLVRDEECNIDRKVLKSVSFMLEVLLRMICQVCTEGIFDQYGSWQRMWKCWFDAAMMMKRLDLTATYHPIICRMCCSIEHWLREVKLATTVKNSKGKGKEGADQPRNS